MADRAKRGRKKKLIVAFHFELSNQAGWRCDICRKSGLEIKRRCGWIPVEARGAARLVWARRGVALDECPKPYITAESQSFLEDFFVRRRLRAPDSEELSARQVEAFLILEKELAAELDARRRMNH
jgi:hypothetical protein